MTSAALLEDLRQRGVQVVAEGESLRCRAPRGTLTDEDVAALRVHKAELLAELSQGEAGDLAAAPILETRERLGAVLIRSARYDEVWLALDSGMAEEIRAEEQGHEEPRPVLVPEDVARLRGKSEKAIRAALKALAVLPGARLIQ